MFDVIGDIHGHAEELKLLLLKLGYQQHGDGFRHSDRQIIFVGDFVDRGPAIAEAIRIARATVDNGDGFAVMGNHEYNAIAFDTKIPGSNDAYFRPRDEKNTHQHAATLNQLSTSELADAIAWFKTLPVALEHEGIRVVHAAWVTDDIARLQRAQKECGNFTADFLAESELHGSDLFWAVDNVLKGPTIRMPEDHWFADKAGHRRRSVRIKWYESPQARSFKDYHLGTNTIPDVPISLQNENRGIDNTLGHIEPYPADAPPVFVGHYWLKGTPAPLALNVACTDYSVAKQGKLCGYRWHGEQTLVAENFVSVDAQKSV